MLGKMSFFIRILLCLTAVIVIAITIPAYYFSVSLQKNLLEETKKQAFEKLEIVNISLKFDDENISPQTEYKKLEKALAKQNLRLTIMKITGDVIYDSSVDSNAVSFMDNHADRPEFKNAMDMKEGFSLRYSNTLNTNFIYVASLLDNGHILRLAFPYDTFEKRMNIMLKAIIFIFALSMLLALALAFALSYGIKKQLKTMLDVIDAISFGKYNSRLHHVPGKEFAVLAQAVNRMAENIENQLNIKREQSVQLEGIFHTMQDGILLLDSSGNVKHTNKALRKLCSHLPDEDMMPEDQKMQVIECIASPLLQNTIDTILKPQKTSHNIHLSPIPLDPSTPIESCSQKQGLEQLLTETNNSHCYLELELFSGRHFAIYLAKPETPTKDMGLVIVVHEITEIMHLEKIRKDFVANVSHELRTPLTAIQGYAETLESMPELSNDCRRFAQIIHKHGSYLNVMIEDLLSLARIENEKESFVLSHVSALDAFNTAAGFCHNALQKNKLELEVNISDKIMVQANRTHLERVFRNLLENACRYSLPESSILIYTKTNQSTCEFIIENQGIYISPEHIERIFERFYRVEKNRSSSLNASGSGASTGLGLAICKHIIDRHGGTIRAQSTNHKTYGVSSFIFTLSLVDAQLNNEDKNEK